MSVSEVKYLSDKIKEKAIDLGFDLCGIAGSRRLDEYGQFLKDWVTMEMNDRMGYLARDIEKRLNPGILFPGAKSLVVTGLNYFAEPGQKDQTAPVLSRYTYGLDYHDVILTKLGKLLSWIKGELSEAEGKAVVDSSSVLEKAWAVEAGLGWQGRHSIVINKDIGSFFFIGILILNIELEPDAPFSGEHCGACRLCINTCPTGAINENRTIDARKCIANITIENRGPIPEDIKPLLGRRIYGCDKCQEVCPWNKKAKLNKTPEFRISKEVAEMSRDDWQNLSREQFVSLFGRSPVGRVKYEQFIRNIQVVTAGNNQK
jgi:epoxyqueuosine reductase